MHVDKAEADVTRVILDPARLDVNSRVQVDPDVKEHSQSEEANCAFRLNQGCVGTEGSGSREDRDSWSMRHYI